MQDTSSRGGGWFGNLRVGVKIALALAVALLAGALVAVVGMAGMDKANTNATLIYEENLKPSATIAHAHSAFDDEVFSLAMMNIANTPALVESERQEALQAAGLVDQLMQGYRDHGLQAAQQASPVAVA